MNDIALRDEVTRLRIELDNVLAELERVRIETKPIVELHNASKLIGRLVIFVGGFIAAVITLGPTVHGWIGAHWK